MTTRRGLPAICAAAAATLLLAACGGSNGDGPSADQSFEAKRLAFFDCMRKAGLDVQTQSSGGRRDTAIRSPKGISPARLQTIQRDCARKTGGGPRELSKAEQAKFLDQALKFARCMRAHGIDMPDPKATGGGIAIRKRSDGSGSSGPNPDSPAFQSAQRECQSFMPKGGRLSTRRGGGGADSGPSQNAVIG
jgi:hypothetical protein